ncbi:uncharacterized protein LOC133525165 [Cydia pomonella]|uniref:uncharacterized protein LOC133525165 n=1 Tax=Cydia pomonella TaxID=82600 RepID=UPI002ADE50A2|nr:uncharacterized protein LOC133525165 [Cydia pomonella]
MSVRHVISSIISCSVLIFTIKGQGMIGTGKWTLVVAQNCSRDAEMPHKMYMHKHKLNRTHNYFDLGATIPEVIDNSIAVRVDIKRKVDGAWKQYMIWADDCLPCACKQFAGKNMKRGFEAAGIDPPDFPIPKGRYDIHRFIVDSNGLPKFGMWGEWMADAYVMKDGKDMACQQVLMTYEKTDLY